MMDSILYETNNIDMTLELLRSIYHTTCKFKCSKQWTPSIDGANLPYSKQNSEVYGHQNVIFHLLFESVRSECDQSLTIYVFQQ
jgi:hypothetical protein